MKKHPRRFSFWLSLTTGCLFGLALVTLPSQNESVAQVSFRRTPVRSIDFSLPRESFYPQPKDDLEAPVLTATGAAILDRQSGVFLYLKNPDQPLLPASTTKIMTALTSLEHYSPLEVLMVPRVSDEGQDMKLVEGELITVQALLHGLLISSANDAAEVLAQNYPGGEKEFVAAMNRKAQVLGLKNTFFTNPSGLDNGSDEFFPSQESRSSARDLAWLADQALKNETFAQIIAIKAITLKDPQGKFFHPLYNLNQLLWQDPRVKGVKTGWTERARECLVTLTDQNNQELIFVVLGSTDRFGETEKLINWVENHFSWEELTPPQPTLVPPLAHKP